jgi:hypothetical protein
MTPVEKYILSLMEQMVKMQQPLNILEGLSLANSLIEGTVWEDAVIKLKCNRGWNPMDENGNHKPVLDQKWFKNFGCNTATCLKKRKGTSF